MLIDGLKATLIMTSFATVIGLFLGLLISVIRVAHRGGARIGLLNALANLYIAVMRGTPVMVQLLIWNFSIFAAVRDINTKPALGNHRGQGRHRGVDQHYSGDSQGDEEGNRNPVRQEGNQQIGTDPDA